MGPSFSSSTSRRSIQRLTHFTIFLSVLIICSVGLTEAYDSLDPNGNITIKWDVMQWTPDGYVAVVTIYNYQQYRHIQAPGWELRWTWPNKEIIWSAVGAQATTQGDCSRFEGNIPHCCEKDPTVVDLLPGTPYNMQIANCCRGGVISTRVQDSANAASSFQLTVGEAGTTNLTVRPPKNFTLKAPGPGYTCGVAKIVKPTRFTTADGNRVTQALMTWNVVCTYSQFLAQKTPTCCVSLSSFYNSTIVDCPTCSCSCRKSKTCVEGSSHYPSSAADGSGGGSFTPLVRCTPHMCPVKVHWHVEHSFKGHWRAMITITNFNYRMNYTQWNLVIQHPDLNNLTRVPGFNYKFLNPYAGINDTAMLWGVRHHNDVLRQAGNNGQGYVRSEILFPKDLSAPMVGNGQYFPRRLYFNGDMCVMPPPSAYPSLPNTSP